MLTLARRGPQEHRHIAQDWHLVALAVDPVLPLDRPCTHECKIPNEDSGESLFSRAAQLLS